MRHVLIIVHPLSLSLLTAGKRCMVYDCVYHPKTYQRAQKVTMTTPVTMPTRITRLFDITLLLPKRRVILVGMVTCNNNVISKRRVILVGMVTGVVMVTF